MKKLLNYEVSFYLLVIALCMLERGNVELCIILILLGFFRIFTDGINKRYE